jgi:hypothetical protein
VDISAKGCWPRFQRRPAPWPKQEFRERRELLPEPGRICHIKTAVAGSGRTNVKPARGPRTRIVASRFRKHSATLTSGLFMPNSSSSVW